MLKVYIASFFETRERLRPIRDKLNAMNGHYQVLSTWLDEGKKPEAQTKAEWWKSLACKDLNEIDEADIVILDTLDVNPRGGREVEWGYALSKYSIKSVYIVGPLRNVFHTQCDHQFKTWDDLLWWFSEDTIDEACPPGIPLDEPWIVDPVEEAKKNESSNKKDVEQQVRQTS